VLGLGASTKALAEGFHDIPFEHPAGKLRDTVTSVRALLSGLPAQLRQPSGARPLRLGQPPAPELPIWVAALGPNTTRVAAELGDGWIPALVTRDRLPARAAQLNRLRETATPGAKPLTVVAGPIAAADENPDAARDIVASCIAWYLGAMGDVYRRSLSGQGYSAEVAAVLAANPRPSPQRGTVPLDAEIILDQLAAYGTGDQIRQQLLRWDQAADIVTILLPPGMSWSSIEATLLAAAPSTAPEIDREEPATTGDGTLKPISRALQPARPTWS
jgi:alkanesulfonate monooxygenase SsuD/methylene tetrahydromethanopterin reductase-like flavin-dependent oxidoreductase (luciferase family)